MRRGGLIMYINQIRGFSTRARVKINLGLSMPKRYRGSAIEKKLLRFVRTYFLKTRRCRNASGIGYR
jgi:hypothetical protein